MKKEGWNEARTPMENALTTEIIPRIADVINSLGGCTDVARMLVERGYTDRLTPQAVWNWCARGYCPPRYAKIFDELTGIDRLYLVDPEIADAMDGICIDLED